MNQRGVEPGRHEYGSAGFSSSPRATASGRCLDGLPVPEAFPLDEEFDELSRTFIVASNGEHATDGRWAAGPAPPAPGDFTAAVIQATGGVPVLPPGDPRLYCTPVLEETADSSPKQKMHSAKPADDESTHGSSAALTGRRHRNCRASEGSSSTAATKPFRTL